MPTASEEDIPHGFKKLISPLFTISSVSAHHFVIDRNGSSVHSESTAETPPSFLGIPDAGKSVLTAPGAPAGSEPPTHPPSQRRETRPLSAILRRMPAWLLGRSFGFSPFSGLPPLLPGGFPFRGRVRPRHLHNNGKSDSRTRVRVRRRRTALPVCRRCSSCSGN